eukprot:373392_1
MSTWNLVTVDKNKKAWHGLKRQGSFIKEVKCLSWNKWSILIVAFLFWTINTPKQNIIVSTYIASAFYVIETLFCSILWNFQFSTAEQFLINILVLPYLWPLFHNPLSEYSLWIRVILTPLFIWILEIIEGYLLIILFGYNRAWTYYGKDSFFHGAIKLSYFPLWLVIGFTYSYFGGDVIYSMEIICF